jgi:hypothetical protein
VPLIQEDRLFDTRVWAVSVLYVVLAGFVAWRAGTLSIPRPEGMGFLQHGGMWSDLLLLPIANGAIVPYLPALTRRRIAFVLAILAASALLTIRMHVFWMDVGWDQRSSGFMFTQDRAAIWSRGMVPAGWLHLAYMTLEVTLLSVYALCPMPRWVTVTVTTVLTLHIPVAIIQPGWYTGGRLLSSAVVVPAAAVALMTLSSAAVKLRGLTPGGWRRR